MKRTMRKKCLLCSVLFAGMLALTGCGETPYELEDNEREIIVNYAAHIIAKYNKKQPEGYRYVYVPEEEEEEPEEQPEEPADTGEATAQNRETRFTESVRLRAEPSTEAEYLGTAYQGEHVTQIESYGDGWSKIKYNDKECYCKTEFLE